MELVRLWQSETPRCGRRVRGGCILGMELVRLWQSETPRCGRRVRPVGGTSRDFVDVPLRRVQQSRLRGESGKEDARDCYEYARRLKEAVRTGGAQWSPRSL